MFNMIQADLYKMRKSYVLIILLGVTSICAITMSIIAFMISQGRMDIGTSGIGFLFSDVNTITILGGVIAAIFICGDFDNKIIHTILSSGSSRWNVVAGKSVSFYLAIVFILLPYIIITGIALGTGSTFNMGSTALGFLYIITQESGDVLSTSVIMKLFAIILTIILIYIAQLSICVPMAFLLKKPVLVIVINYSLNIFLAQLSVIKGNHPLLSIIYSLIPFNGDCLMMSLDVTSGQLIKSIIVSLLFILIMLALTYSIFKKSEVK